QRDQLAAGRQQLSDDLSKLQRDMSQAARDMASEEPDVARHLRDALSEMDDTQLGMYVQRSADWLRSGINPNSNGTESQIAQGLSKLSDQLQGAERAMANARPGEGKAAQGGAGQEDTSDALNQLQRLRSQLEAMAGAQGGLEGQQRDGNGNASSREGRPSGTDSNNGGAHSWEGAQQSLSRNGTAGASGGRGGGAGGNMTRNGETRQGGAGGDTRAGGGGWSGAAWGNYDTGSNTPRGRGRQQPAPGDASGNPADTEQTFDQEMRTLRQLRQTVGNHPDAARQLEQITRQMQQLDPRRFPGNPALVEQMHSELLGSVDRLELELQRNAQTDARTGKPDPIPAGYQEQVAEYYRRLSKK
ncbi:MAG: hypothetical protein ACLGP3_09255, partial [Acidobacteriota bacterium]